MLFCCDADDSGAAQKCSPIKAVKKVAAVTLKYTKHLLKKERKSFKWFYWTGFRTFNCLKCKAGFQNKSDYMTSVKSNFTFNIQNKVSPNFISLKCC